MICTTTNTHCYAVRRLNPFRGVVQIIQIDDCRAISTTGEQWEIQVKVKQPEDLWGGESKGEPIYRYVRFGTWTKKSGLEQVPAHPLFDLTLMFKKADEVIALLQPALTELPFPLRDNFELWLLDGQQRMPLALLHSVANPEQISLYNSHKWVATEGTDGDFPSPRADQERPPHPKDTNPHRHLSALTSIIRDNAGHALAQWFERQQDGSGEAIELSNFEELSKRTLPTGAFPELLIRPHRDDAYEHALISDYLAWQAPQLLTLQHISDRTRSELEQHALNRAIEVDNLWKLYPKTIDPNFVNTARVEARLRATVAKPTLATE
ncbi:MAG: hypothetical protein MI754_07430 [Chromatiales bacterium]|nr:hypothetical protein [Chromatiales bacterium]